MARTLFRSKPLAAAVLILFTAVLASEGFAQSAGQAQTEFTKAFEAGKKLYTDGEHKEAVVKFLQALTSAKDKSEITESCFYLSLTYYGLGESDNAQSYLKRLFDVQPDREIDARLYSAGYVTLFYRTKSEMAGQRPPKIEEKAKDEAKAREDEKKPAALPGKAAAEPGMKKKGKFPWLIVGALVVVTGVALYLLLNKKKSEEEPPAQVLGAISVSSTPSAASVSLDGTDTGRTTPCTLSNISSGSHAVKLVRDGYTDFQQDVTVTAGQTVTVSATLTKNTIIVTSPATGVLWGTGSINDIRWQVDSAAMANRGGVNPLPRDGADREDPPPPSEIPEKSGAGYLRRNRSVEDRRKSEGRKESTPPIANSRPDFSRAHALPARGLLGIIKVKIELFKGDSLVSVVIAETNNIGSYAWTVPENLTDGTDYKVRISCSTDPSVYGDSKFFIIRTILYQPAAFWGGQGIDNGQFDSPQGIAVDGTGSVYVSDYLNHRIQKFTATGAFLAKWGSYGSGNGQFKFPWGIGTDSAGYVYVADSGNDRIQIFNSAGTFISKFGASGTGDGQFQMPVGVAISGSGNIYVLDLFAQVQKFNSSGSFLVKWGSKGAASGQFNTPHGVAVDGSSNVYVGDTLNDRIQKFDPNGVYLAGWGILGSANGQFHGPCGVAVDNAGSVYVADQQNDRIQKFSSDGRFVTKWGTLGTANNQFDKPGAVALTPAGNVYVLDYENCRVMLFRPITAAPPQLHLTPGVIPFEAVADNRNPRRR